ncbi:MAG: sigma-70 family RNA polymerase sigma factor [Pyrinomonadaceae bacterium]
MPDRDQHQITQLLNDWNDGNDVALQELMPLVYDELRRMAKRYMSGQNKGHTFQTTELIHEAYLKLAKSEKQNWKNRAHFFGVAATAMRHILVNYALSKNAQKRGGEAQKVTLNDDSIVSLERSDEIVALDDALKELAALDERSSRVVEMKFFGGMTNEETAEVLKVSTETVKRDWQFARSWLLREVAGT